MATQKESPVDVMDPRRGAEQEVTRLTAKVVQLEKDLRQARADERRARANLHELMRQQEL